MRDTKKGEVYIVFSGGTEAERKSLLDTIYDEIVVDNEAIFEKKRRELPNNVKGYLSISPEYLEPNTIILYVNLVTTVIVGIKKLISLIRRREKKSKKVEITLVIDGKTIVIKDTETDKS